MGGESIGGHTLNQSYSNMSSLLICMFAGTHSFRGNDPVVCGQDLKAVWCDNLPYCRIRSCHKDRRKQISMKGNDSFLTKQHHMHGANDGCF